MKRFLAALIMTVGMAGVAGATTVVYDQYLVNNQVVSSSQNYVIDLSSGVIDLLSASVSLSTASPASATFKDGHISSGTFTISSATFLSAQQGSDILTVSNNNNLTASASTDTITVSSNGVSAIGNSTITVMGVLIRGTTDFTVGASSAITATSIAAAINNQVPNVTASASFGVVTITCINTGSFCNSYTLVSSTPAALAVGGAKFSGGNDNAFFSLNGHAFYQGIDWTKGTTSSDTAVSILNSLTPLADYTASTNTTTSVQIKCATKGSFCNSVTLTSSTGSLPANTATFTGGQNNAIVGINGVLLTQGTDFTAGSSSATAANAIAAAINANSSLSSIVTATAPAVCGIGSGCGIVLTTGTIALTGNNYNLYASSGVTLSSFTLLNGATSAYLANTKTISLPNHGMATAMQVLYSTASAVAIGGLTNKTTYFIIAVDANDVKLASSAANAAAGTAITLTSTATVGGNSFTLAPLAMSGTTVVTWQGSDDNTNWSNLSVSTSSIGSNGAAVTTVYDFGAVNIKYIRANVVPAGAGGVNLTIRAIGKSQ